MKELLVTQKRYEQLNGIRGGLIIVAIRILIGVIISFVDAYLIYSYISWGFEYSDVYPLAYIALGFVYCVDAYLLFNKKQAFMIMYLVSAMAFIVLNATFPGWGYLICGGVESLLAAYLFTSKRVAVTFQTKRVRIIDTGYEKGTF